MPRSAGPARKVKSAPAFAASIEPFIASAASVQPIDDAMWYIGVKKPVPWYVAAATIAYMAMTTAPRIPPAMTIAGKAKRGLRDVSVRSMRPPPPSWDGIPRKAPGEGKVSRWRQSFDRMA